MHACMHACTRYVFLVVQARCFISHFPPQRRAALGLWEGCRRQLSFFNAAIGCHAVFPMFILFETINASILPGGVEGALPEDGRCQQVGTWPCSDSDPKPKEEGDPAYITLHAGSNLLELAAGLRGGS